MPKTEARFTAFATLWTRLLRWVGRGDAAARAYRPERNYMRGPGEACTRAGRGAGH
ncbi:hypothetical protein [Vannielia litorea]|uniref:Uncharacterized protein n=1 Tax=Vannielia litorea TaxID=1217970 RepID=A0A1N6E3D6_9RHOB|nr:hypothetical protein [Vannielia litorea]SIN77528.1 hypothetical protein SAMN05444002_0291 [Vannielia litorea]